MGVDRLTALTGAECAMTALAALRGVEASSRG